MFNSIPQPAIKSYYFGKGYRDLSNVIKDSWNLNLSSAKIYAAQASVFYSKGGLYYFAAAGAWFAAMSVVLFGSILFGALSVIHIIILAFFFFIIYVGFMIILILDTTYRKIKGIFTACPYCHAKNDLPYYICSNPKCNTSHTRLVPNAYGIWKRTCQCGQKLATSFFNGRGKLEAKCPNCARSLTKGIGESKPVCITITGGPSVGKTCFLFAALNLLIEEIAMANTWALDFLDKHNEDMYNKIISGYKRGVTPNKTTEIVPTAFNIFIKHQSWSPDKLLYFYDAAGEAYMDSQNLSGHLYMGYVHGIIFIVDPFSIPEVLDKYKDRIAHGGSEVRPSGMMLEDSFNVMVINMEKNHGVKREQKLHIPFAIVINKIDAFDLENEIGEAPARQLMATRNDIKNMRTAIDTLCKELFETWGLGNFLRQVEQKFGNFHFFTCSTLGHMPGSVAEFKPKRVDEPLMWVLQNADRDFTNGK